MIFYNIFTLPHRQNSRNKLLEKHSNLINLAIILAPIDIRGFLIEILPLHLLALLLEGSLSLKFHVDAIFLGRIFHLCYPRNVSHWLSILEFEVIVQEFVLFRFTRGCRLLELLFLRCMEGTGIRLPVYWRILHSANIDYIMAEATLDVIIGLRGTVCAVLLEVLLCWFLKTFTDLIASHLPVKPFHFLLGHQIHFFIDADIWLFFRYLKTAFWSDGLL